MNTNGRHSTAPPPIWSIQDLRAELAKKIAWFIGNFRETDHRSAWPVAGAQDCADGAMLRNVHAERDRGCTG